MSYDWQLFLPLIFPRLLGGIYFLAFASLLVQVRGLYGASGILPICEYMEMLKGELGEKVYRMVPSLLWLRCNDDVIFGAAVIGVVLALLLTSGLFPAAPLLILLWLLYLSFVSVGQEFLSYQWDTLLLETGFWSIFLPLFPIAPPLVVFCYRFFLFRFMLSAGLVKVLSGDATWRNLTALCFHYQTQPIPNWAAWWVHQLPVPVQKFSTGATLLIELLVPFLALGPQPARIACFVLLVCFQLLIFATGNYGFFNLLTIVLCLPLLDDGIVGLVLPLHMPVIPGSQVLPLMLDVIFGIFLVLNLCQLIALFYRPVWIRKIFRHLAPFMISNHYGLFAVMTTTRFEFVIEGSKDGSEWLTYEFHWKPGDPKQPPRQVAPHQPRLDWQMWFAALEPNTLEPWLGNLVLRLLEGTSHAVRLLRVNPFPQEPPKYIRLTVYRYLMATHQKLRDQGIWWDRTLIGRFKPMALKGKG